MFYIKVFLDKNIGLNTVKVRKIIFPSAWRHETPLKTLNGRGDKKGACRKYDCGKKLATYLNNFTLLAREVCPTLY